jgi:hypothetical protein
MGYMDGSALGFEFDTQQQSVNNGYAATQQPSPEQNSPLLGTSAVLGSEDSGIDPPQLQSAVNDLRHLPLTVTISRLQARLHDG